MATSVGGRVLFSMTNYPAPRAYRLLSALVIPRPIALITTVSPTGQVNCAPFSFFNVVGSDPPMVFVAPSNRPGTTTPKDTAINILATGEFVVNLCDEPLAQQMVACATDLPYGESELDLAKLSSAPSHTVKPPFVPECPVSIECSLFKTDYLGNNRVVYGAVKAVHMRENIINLANERINYDNYHPIGRLNSPDGYTTTKPFYIPFPSRKGKKAPSE
eukprot:comp26171_c0_seq1/m.62086 comp26171_c0_seq1/g.62086  ORF comp26171_c0_seq1/g.62086 comp26171_c0_seq1/m.62086 type:complete len:218 (+) comp26171_c0_seq1:62-715(+)